MLMKLKALILPAMDIQAFKPLTDWEPEYLLPLVNKPLVGHLVELLVRCGVREARMILKHMPYETEKYFEDGSRWGLRITYSLQSGYRGLRDSLTRIGAWPGDDDLLCLPSNAILDLNLADFVEAHRAGGTQISMIAEGPDDGSPNVRAATPEDLRRIDFTPAILSAAAAARLCDASGYGAEGVAGSPVLTVHSYRGRALWSRLDCPADFLAVNRAILERVETALLLPGKPIASRIWVGRHSRIDPSADLRAPLLIGNNCHIRGGCTAGPGTVVGDRVIVDRNASVAGSVVFADSYVGPYAGIKNAVIKQNRMLQLPSGLEICLGDNLILGDLRKKTLTRTVERVANVLIAAVLTVVASPLLLGLHLYHRLFPWKKFLYTEKRCCGYFQEDLGGEFVPVWRELRGFRSRFLFIRKLPCLLNVLKGHLRLVGVSPLTEAEHRGLETQWLSLRSSAPVGLFQLWELEGEDVEWDAKMVSEGYYAVSHSFLGDIRILFGILLHPGRLRRFISKTFGRSERGPNLSGMDG